MSQLLERAKNHFKELINNTGLLHIEVPEWGENGQAAKIYFQPLAACSVKTYSRFVELGTQQTVEAFIDMLILRCLDSEGKPLFKPVDKTEMLRHISPVVVCNIIKQMSEKEKESPIDTELANTPFFCNLLGYFCLALSCVFRWATMGK